MSKFYLIEVLERKRKIKRVRVSYAELGKARKRLKKAREERIKAEFKT